jgi:branched-chain amino acid transport system substrate-binding protein
VTHNFQPIAATALVAAFAAHAAPALNVGAALPLSGSEAKSGARLRDGYELAVAIANEQGGVELGSRRLPVKLTVVDDKSDSAADARAVEELVANGAEAILGTSNSTLVESGSAVADKLHTPYVAPIGASRALYQRGFNGLFGLQAPVEQMANSILRFAEEEQQQRKLTVPLRVAVLVEQTPHGKEYADGVQDFVTKTARRRASFQVVLNESFQMNLKDPKPLMSRVKEARADVMLVDAHVPDYIAIQSQHGRMGLCHQLVSYGARGPEREAREQLKEGADYVLSAVGWSAQMLHTQLVTEFISKFQARYQREPDWYEALGYEAAHALLEAVKRAGSTDRAAIRDALAKLRMESILPGGFLAFPEQYGGQAHYLLVVLQNMPDGTAPVIYPKIAAVRDGVAPNPHCSPTSAKLP